MVATASLQNAQREPGSVLHSSLSVPWRSLLFQVVRSPGEVTLHETLPTRDPNFTAILAGASVIESASSGVWRKTNHQVGSGGSTPPFHVDRLRWRQVSKKPLITGHLYIPADFFSEAVEDLNFRQAVFPNTHGFVDPLITRMILSIARAVESGEPELYAESAARFLEGLK
jgi:AraC family transcriptional regulator